MTVVDWLLDSDPSLAKQHPGATHFAMEDGDGAPSRWTTLRARRVLSWWRG